MVIMGCKIKIDIYSKHKIIPQNVINARIALYREYPNFYRKIYGYEDCRDIEMLDVIECYAIITSTPWRKVKNIVLEFINHKSEKTKLRNAKFTKTESYIDPYKFYSARSAKMIRGR